MTEQRSRNPSESSTDSWSLVERRSSTISEDDCVITREYAEDEDITDADSFDNEPSEDESLSEDEEATDAEEPVEEEAAPDEEQEESIDEDEEEDEEQEDEESEDSEEDEEVEEISEEEGLEDAAARHFVHPEKVAEALDNLADDNGRERPVHRIAFNIALCNMFVVVGGLLVSHLAIQHSAGGNYMLQDYDLDVFEGLQSPRVLASAVQEDAAVGAILQKMLAEITGNWTSPRNPNSWAAADTTCYVDAPPSKTSSSRYALSVKRPGAISRRPSLFPRRPTASLRFSNALPLMTTESDNATCMRQTAKEQQYFVAIPERRSTNMHITSYRTGHMVAKRAPHALTKIQSPRPSNQIGARPCRNDMRPCDPRVRPCPPAKETSPCDGAQKAYGDAILERVKKTSFALPVPKQILKPIYRPTLVKRPTVVPAKKKAVPSYFNSSLTRSLMRKDATAAGHCDRRVKSEKPLHFPCVSYKEELPKLPRRVFPKPIRKIKTPVVYTSFKISSMASKKEVKDAVKRRASGKTGDNWYTLRGRGRATARRN